jgi:hypothetical protein
MIPILSVLDEESLAELVDDDEEDAVLSVLGEMLEEELLVDCDKVDETEDVVDVVVEMVVRRCPSQNYLLNSRTKMMEE